MGRCLNTLSQVTTWWSGTGDEPESCVKPDTDTHAHTERERKKDNLMKFQ